MIKNLPNVCSGLLKSKDREKFMYFSKTVNILYPNELIIRKKDYKKFKPFIKNGEIDLKKAVESGKFTFAFGKLSHYGKHIDEVICKYRYKKSKKFLVLSKASLNKLMLLKYKRIDGFFAYPVEFLWECNILGYNPNEFMILKIKGTKYIPSYIACSKTKEGKKIIEKMNKYIEKNREKLLSYYLRWIDKESAKKLKQDIKKYHLYERFDKE